jgi:hypothetical protein
MFLIIWNTILKIPMLLVKTAPLLDISAGILELQNVKTIHIVALENDERNYYGNYIRTI